MEPRDTTPWQQLLSLVALIFRLLLVGLVVPLLIIAGCVKLIPDIVFFDRIELRAVIALIAVLAYLLGMARWYAWCASRLDAPNARARYRRK